MIDTGKVTDRRRLRFNTVDDLLSDMDRIVAADKAGNLRRTGNWTTGQVFGHLAAWINYGYEGFPMQPPPWFVRIIVKMMKKKYLRDGMPAGFHMPKVESGTYGTEVLSTDEGANRLRAALARMKREPPKYDSPAFGKLLDDERIGLTLRHAELHLGFLHP